MSGVSNTAASPQQGLYIKAPLDWGSGGFQLQLLIDCGATVSLLDSRVYESIPEEVRPPLEAVEIKVTFADGSEQQCAGKVSFPLKLGEEWHKIEFLVGRWSDPALLGMRELQSLGLKIDFKGMVVTKENSWIPTHDRSGTWTARRVELQKAAVIPPRSQLVVEGCVREPASMKDEYKPPVCLLEPNPTMVEHYGVMPAWSLHKSDQETVPVMIENALEEAIELPAKTIVGMLVDPEGKGPKVARVETGKVDVQETKAEADDTEDVKEGELPTHLKEMYEKGCVHLSAKQKEEVKELLVEFQDVFSKNNYDLGKTHLLQHEVDTGDSRPTKQNPRRQSPAAAEAADKIIDELLMHNLIEPSSSSWASPIVMVKRKDGRYRMCIDFREVNKKTLNADAFPLPRIDDTLDSLSGAKWFCTTDLTAGYWQVPMDSKSKCKTAFCTRRGLFEWNVLPFGLMAGPGSFMRLMEMILADMRYLSCLVFIDDVIIFGKSFEETLGSYRKFCMRMREAGLKLKPSKCSLFQKSVSFLGHIVSEEGISTDPEKVAAVQDWPVPKKMKDVRSFLGLVGYYRKFIPNCSEVAKPLTELTSPSVDFKWTDECQRAFESLKCSLLHAPILGYPKEDGGSFILDTDASNYGIGGVLSQVQDNKEVVIAYASRTLSPAETNYCVTRKELLAIVHHVKLFKNYLLGRPFLVRTDHSSLKFLYRFKEPEGQLARWIDFLQSYTFQIEHRPGLQHANADALSRQPTGQCEGKKCYCQSFEDLQYEPPVVMETQSLVDTGVQASPDLDLCETVRRGCSVSDREPKEVPIKCSTGVQTSERVRLVSVEPMWSLEEIREAQLADPDIRIVLLCKESGASRPDWSQISAYSDRTKSMFAEWERLEVRSGLLRRNYVRADGKVTWSQLILPQKLWKEALHFAHDTATAGHAGVSRTIAKLRARFWWPKMGEFAKRWVATCDVCQQRKGPTKRAKAPLQKYVVGVPGERIAADIMGPFSETERGNRYILVIIDYFTKYAVAVPLIDMTAEAVANAIIERWISYFGLPKEFHSDRGSQFEGTVMREICTLLGIEKTRTTALRPQGDGLAERLNRTLCDMLNCVGRDSPFEWDILLSMVTVAYNSNSHESTQETPNAMLFGRELSIPASILVPSDPEGTLEAEYASEYVMMLQEKLNAIHKTARDRLEKAGLKQERGYNNRLRYHEYKVGDVVYYCYPVKTRVPKEAFFKWKGPFVVVEKISNTVYRIQKSLRAKSLVVNHDSMKVAELREPMDVSWVSKLCKGRQEVSSKDAETALAQPVRRPQRRQKPVQRLGEWVYC